MTQERANGSRYDRIALAIGVGCLFIAAMAAVVVETRWRAGREIAPAVPLPRMGRLVKSETVPEPDPGPVSRPICAHELEVPAGDVDALHAYADLLIDSGWERRDDETASSVPVLSFRSGPRRLTVALLESGSESWTRLRVRLRPCD